MAGDGEVDFVQGGMGRGRGMIGLKWRRAVHEELGIGRERVFAYDVVGAFVGGGGAGWGGDFGDVSSCGEAAGGGEWG